MQSNHGDRPLHVTNTGHHSQEDIPPETRFVIITEPVKPCDDALEYGMLFPPPPIIMGCGYMHKWKPSEHGTPAHKRQRTAEQPKQ